MNRSTIVRGSCGAHRKSHDTAVDRRSELLVEVSCNFFPLLIGDELHKPLIDYARKVKHNLLLWKCWIPGDMDVSRTMLSREDGFLPMFMQLQRFDRAFIDVGSTAGTKPIRSVRKTFFQHPIEPLPLATIIHPFLLGPLWCQKCCNGRKGSPQAGSYIYRRTCSLWIHLRNVV